MNRYTAQLYSLLLLFDRYCKCLYPNYKLLSQYFLGMHRTENSWPNLKPNKWNTGLMADYWTRFFAFPFMKLLFWQSFYSDKFGKMFVAGIALSHALKKT